MGPVRPDVLEHAASACGSGGRASHCRRQGIHQGQEPQGSQAHDPAELALQQLVPRFREEVGAAHRRQGGDRPARLHRHSREDHAGGRGQDRRLRHLQRLPVHHARRGRRQGRRAARQLGRQVQAGLLGRRRRPASSSSTTTASSTSWSTTATICCWRCARTWSRTRRRGPSTRRSSTRTSAVPTRWRSGRSRPRSSRPRKATRAGA